METKPIIGQEAICPDGLGRVADFNDQFPYSFVQVDTYIANRSCKWDPKNVELIDPRGATKLPADVLEFLRDVARSGPSSIAAALLQKYRGGAPA